MARHLTNPTTLLALCCAALSTACGRDAPSPAPELPEVPTGPSLVLVTLDTTRADRIGAYGYDKAQTPAIDRLAAEGARFERAYAAVPLTTPSHASMLTGLNPPRHGVRNNGDAILPDGIETLAEQLRARGYRTAASVSAFVTTRVWNLDQGFDTYFDEVATGAGRGRWGQERPASEVTDDLVHWLEDPENGSGPFFLWAHFYDPHHPHQAPEPFDTQLESAYDGEIAYVDSQVARLREAVEKAAGPAGASWIVVADHGEAFEEEHGEVTHGLFVFDPTMRVPFIVRPAQPLAEARVLAEPTVGGVDVMPTALGLLGFDPPGGLDGRDLSGVVRGGTPERPPVYMESVTARDRFGYHPEIAAAEGHWKLIDTPDARLYDLAADPGETRNLLGRQPDIEARLQAAAEAAWSAEPAHDATAPAPEVFGQLAALGYMNNDFELDPAAADLDAKDKLDTIQTLESIRTAMATTRDFAQAEQDYRALIAAEPQIGEARMGLARALSAQDKDAEAEQTYREALERQPHSALLRVNLANALAAQGRMEEGLAEMRAVLDQVPGDNLAQVGTLRMLTDLGRLDEARGLASAWLEEKPDDPWLMAHLGIVLGRLNQPAEAERLLRGSLSDGVPRQLVHQGLAVIEAVKGRPRLAIMHYRKEMEAFPGSRDLHFQVAQLLLGLQEWEDAATEFEAYAATHPDDVPTRLGWAQAVFNTGDYPRADQILAPAVAAAPENPDVLLLHANIMGKIGDHDEAVKIAERAKELHRQRVARLEEARAKARADQAPAEAP